MRYVRLPAPVPTVPPTAAIELDEVYMNPGEFIQIRFYPCVEKLADDPTWVRPLIEDPDFEPSEGDEIAPLIPDAAAVCPKTLQFFRHPMLGKSPETRRIDGAHLAAFEASLSTHEMPLDEEGIDPITRLLLKAVWAAEQAELAAMLGTP